MPGINESGLRFDDYINDAREWIQLLKQDKRFSKVIVIGHSEGSLIGMIAGAIPAYRASKLKPVDALRYE